MVDSISSFNPATYLSQIEGAKPITVAAAPAAITPITPAAPPASSSASSPSSPPATNLLGLSSDVLSVLQGTNSSSSNGGLLSNLFGSSSISTPDPLSGLFNSLLTQDSSTLPTQQAIASTQQLQTQNSATNDQVQNVLNSYNSGLNAYNQTLLQNAKLVLAANSTPITA